MTPIAEVTSYDTLIEALRRRKAMLGMTHAALDDLTGLQSGYVGKLLGPAGIKTLGPMSFDVILEALAVKLVLVEDVEAAKRMVSRWEKRERPPAKVGIPSMAFVRRKFAPTIQGFLRRKRVKGGQNRWKGVSKEERSRIARKGARERWRRHRMRRAFEATKPAVRSS